LVKREYRIMMLEVGPGETIILGLLLVYPEQTPQPSEEPKSPDPTRVIAGPQRQSEDARMGYEMMKGMMDGMMDSLKGAGVPFGRGSNAAAPATFVSMGLTLLLSKEEYAELGKPTPNEIITITLALDRQAEPQLEAQPSAKEEEHHVSS
jgi:NAD(P)-dependent dehydrogenase (short-subunit alcohol dehydrogenase family)